MVFRVSFVFGLEKMSTNETTALKPIHLFYMVMQDTHLVVMVVEPCICSAARKLSTLDTAPET